ncbi:MAG: 5-formyltetrahydrofolate cyclo-ligase [bacterium]
MAAEKAKHLDPKESSREAVRLRMIELDPAWILQASRKIQDTVIGLDEFARAEVVGCYVALPTEAQTGAIIAACRKAGKRICVPAYRPGKKDYAMSWYNAGDPMVMGPYGVPEPRTPQWMTPSDIDAMIVPAVAFDEYGRRLGHGGGHFDRILTGFPGISVCIAFECQKLAAVPAEEHDCEVDLIVTERQIYRPK